MDRWSSFFYGVLAYAAGMGSLAYFVGFSGNLVVPRSVDVGPSAPWPLAVAVDLALLVMFGVQHSVMARPAFKRAWSRVVPPVLERSTYLLATAAVLTLLFASWRPVPAPVVWKADAGWATALLWAGFATGWLLVVTSSALIDHWELFGLRQVWLHLRQRQRPETPFTTPLLYRWVRHPLYLGLLLALWSVPVMTAGRLLLAAGLSAYILLGIRFEERDLLRQFGERYRGYRQRVGMLLPRLRR